jgi:cephalosporin-C deacetylase
MSDLTGLADSLPEQARGFLGKEMPAAPAGFEEFWRETHALAQRISLRARRREVASSDSRRRVFEFECDSFGGVRIGGWIVEPADGVWQRGVVAGHGYGGREQPDFDIPGPPAVVIFPCIRGFNRSACPEIPNVGTQHVLHGIGTRDGYVLRGSVADLWAAASVLLEYHPEVAGSLHYYGGSFCGGLGAFALAWDPRYERAFLDVPTFGNHPERLKVPCDGSGEPVRQLFLKRPGVVEVLAWFDSAVAAQWVRVPVFVAAALVDPSVPPVGQFAVFKGLGGEKRLFVRKSGHPALEDDDELLRSRLDAWFNS